MTSRKGSSLQKNFDPQKSILISMPNSLQRSLSYQTRSPLPPITSEQDNLSTTINEPSPDETNLVLPTKIFQAKKSSVKDLSQALCSYLWFRRIKEIFLVMGKQNDAFTRFDMELARKDMIKTCEQYLENERQKFGGRSLENRDQVALDRWKTKRLYAETFRMSYFRKKTDFSEKTNKVQTLTQTDLSVGEAPNFDNAIWWYSCNEAPIFDQMNNILRLENLELLMCHRYYISDLCQMIEKSYVQDRVSQKKIVFRADKLSVPDFSTIENSIQEKDARITIHGFISTSQNEEISLSYAKKKLEKKKDEEVVIIYEITIDPAIPCSSYADIKSISFHPREEEFLFNMGSTFQIDECVDDPKNPKIKRIKLTARDYNLSALDEMKAKVKQASQASLSILLVRYLIELGEDRICKRYLNQLIESKQLDNDPNLVAVYNCLGNIYFRQLLYTEALECYRKALNTQVRLQFSNNNALAEIFNNIGQTHLELKQLEEAKENFEEGIRIQKREPKYSRQHLASLYCNLGKVDYAQHEWEEAENHFEAASDLYNQGSKISHDALEKRLLQADLCIAFGHLKSIQNPKNPTEATKKFKEALNIYECILPESHPRVAEARINIVCEYTRNKNYEAVINYLNESFDSILQTYETKHTTSQMDLANLYANIGACFAHQNEFNKAVDNWKKSLKHEQKAFLDELWSSARGSKIQLATRLVEGAYRKALQHYSSHTSVPKEYLSILYAKMRDYDQVISILRGECSVLLANIYVTRRNLKEATVVYKHMLEELHKPDTITLTGLLLRMLTMFLSSISSKEKEVFEENPTMELIEIEKSLRGNVGDNEAIRLRMIINDHLAEGYLTKSNWKSALERLQTSFELKQRFYSSYHPSLTHNYQLVASCNFQQGDYKTAVQYYEKAIEIQMNNMSGGHPEVRANYFLMGDCYCQMDKLELATEFYDRAQAPNDNENDEEKEIEQDVKALLRMYDHLSEASARAKDFDSAVDYQKMRIERLRESLPKFVDGLIEDEEATNVTLKQLLSTIEGRLNLTNGRKFAQFLRNFVFIRLSHAEALLSTEQSTDDDEDPIDLYKEAIELHLKLTLFEEKEEQDLSCWYEKLADAYDKLYPSMKEEIQDNLIKALEETGDQDRQRSLEFRLGNLYFDEKNFIEADRYWKSALEKGTDDQTVIKTIIENLIEKNKANLSSSEEENEDEEQDANESCIQSVKSRRRSSTKSLDSKGKIEKIAQAYLKLHDDEQALKYFKRHIAKLKVNVHSELPEIPFDTNQLPLMKLYYILMTNAIDLLSNTENISQKITQVNLLEAYEKIFTIAVQMDDSFDQLSEAMLNIFYLAKQLYKFPDYLVKLFDAIFRSGPIDNLQWNQLTNLIPLTESINLLQIGQYHLSNENWELALNIYCLLQKNIRQEEVLKSAVNYSILKLLELHILADKKYDQNIAAVDIRSSSIPVFDRMILCRLIISYANQRGNNKSAVEFRKKLLDLQREDWSNITLKNCDSIGSMLNKHKQNTTACWYWTEVQMIYNETLTESIVTHLYSKDATFEKIYNLVEEMNNYLKHHIISLALSYEKMSEYERKSKLVIDACKSLEKAIIIWKKISSEKERVQQLQKEADKLKNEQLTESFVKYS